MPDSTGNSRYSAPHGAPRSGLPVPLTRVATAAVAGSAPAATFLSQLIAERDHLAPQRERRRASLSVALGSYATTGASDVLRLPAGYRKSLLA
jgi:hypothetical protein